MADQIHAAGPGRVWMPADFASLGSRDAIDKAMQHLAARNTIRRIDRGLYDLPSTNRLTGRPNAPDSRAVLDALARRDQSRLSVDGMTAANDLGLTDAIPAQVTIYSDTRRRNLKLDRLSIVFKTAATRRLYWAGRPAMRVVQALHWLKDMLLSDDERIRLKLARVLGDPKHGPAIRADLAQGFGLLPAWMQNYLRTVPGFDPMHLPLVASPARQLGGLGCRLAIAAKPLSGHGIENRLLIGWLCRNF